MTIYDDPNREALGLAPAWMEGEGGGDGNPEVEPDATYDPGAHTVDEVLAYVDAHPEEADAILAAEQAGRNRTTLVSALEA